MRLNSFHELPKEKQPPRYMWDRPHELSEFLEHIWDQDGGGSKKGTQFYDFNEEDVE